MIAIFPKIAGCAASGDVERLVCLVREYYGDAEKFAPRLSLAPMLKRVGIPVSRQAWDGVAALAASDKKGRFAVHALLSPAIREGSFEERFALAHLLGHFFLHVQPFIARGDLTFGGFKESLSPLERYEKGLLSAATAGTDRQRDEEADAFAAALLLPHSMLRRAYAKLVSLEKTATFFAVSIPMLQRRLERLGLLSAETTPPFLEAESHLAQKGAMEEARTNRAGQAMAALLQNTSSPASPPSRGACAASATTTPRPSASASSGMPRPSTAASGRAPKEPGSAASDHPFAPLIAGEEGPSDALKGMDRLRAIAQKLDKGAAKI